jgi:hypothetical protein
MSEIFFLCFKEILLLNNYKKVWILKNLLNFLFYLYIYVNFIQTLKFTPAIFSLIYFIYLYIICVNLNYFLSKEKENNHFELLYLSNINIKFWFFFKLLIFFIFTELPFFCLILLFNFFFLSSQISFDYQIYLTVFIIINIFVSQMLCAFVSLLTLILKQNNLLTLFLLLIINLPIILLLEYIVFDVDIINSLYIYQIWCSFSLIFLFVYIWLMEYLFKYLIN